MKKTAAATEMRLLISCSAQVKQLATKAKTVLETIKVKASSKVLISA
jgi:hypothetical protein